MSRLAHARRHLALVLPAALLLGLATQPASTQPRQYRIALSFPFAPWGVSPLEGVDFGLLTAICTANEPMRCQIVDRPSSDCVETDDSGRMLRRDVNCGLALIRQSGEMATICAWSPHPGGDPNGVLEGPAPTVQCLADNPAAAAQRPAGRWRAAIPALALDTPCRSRQRSFDV